MERAESARASKLERGLAELACELVDELEELMLDEFIDEPDLARKAPDLMDELLWESLSPRGWVRLQDSGPTVSIGAMLGWVITGRVVTAVLAELSLETQAAGDAELAALVDAITAERNSPV
jgi:hypothetical protein